MNQKDLEKLQKVAAEQRNMEAVAMQLQTKYQPMITAFCPTCQGGKRKVENRVCPTCCGSGLIKRPASK